MIGKAQALETLRSSDLGAGLQRQDIARLMDLAQIQNLQAGDTVLRQLDPAEAIYLPCSGTVMVDRNSLKGRRQVIGFLQRGDYLGFTSTDRYLYSATAIEECTLLRYQRQRFRRLCDDIPQLATNVARITNMVLASLLDHLFAIGQKRAHERVAFLIYQQYLRQGSPATEVAIRLPMSRTDIGDYLGLTLETTSRAFSRLREESVITTPDHHSVIVKELPTLKILADVD
jgi:CRP-like cAMP-binding protein